MINNDHAVNSLIVFNEFNEEKIYKDNSELHVSMILFKRQRIKEDYWKHFLRKSWKWIT